MCYQDYNYKLNDCKRNRTKSLYETNYFIRYEERQFDKIPTNHYY